MRWFDGETWWYPAADVCRELEIGTGTLYQWRRVLVDGLPLVRSTRKNGTLLVPLVDVFYVLDNKERLRRAGVRLSDCEYSRRMQLVSLAFARRAGEDYTLRELVEIGDRERTTIEAAISHRRTYYGASYARRRTGA